MTQRPFREVWVSSNRWRRRFVRPLGAAGLGLHKGQSILIVEQVRPADDEPLCRVSDELAGRFPMSAAYQGWSARVAARISPRGNTASTSTTVCV